MPVLLRTFVYDQPVNCFGRTMSVYWQIDSWKVCTHIARSTVNTIAANATCKWTCNRSSMVIKRNASIVDINCWVQPHIILLVLRSFDAIGSMYCLRLEGGILYSHIVHQMAKPIYLLARQSHLTRFNNIYLSVSRPF